MNIKQEIRTCKKYLNADYKKMKRWIKDPEAYILHSCGDERETAITNAVFEFGRLNVLKRLEREFSK